MHKPYCYLDSICPQAPGSLVGRVPEVRDLRDRDPARDPNYKKESQVAKTPKTVTDQEKPASFRTMKVVQDHVRDTLLLYSEWLDADAGLMKKPKKKDTRTHEDLVNAFLKEAA